jgi:hypothetical protein
VQEGGGGACSCFTGSNLRIVSRRCPPTLLQSTLYAVPVSVLFVPWAGVSADTSHKWSLRPAVSRPEEHVSSLCVFNFWRCCCCCCCGEAVDLPCSSSSTTDCESKLYKRLVAV